MKYKSIYIILLFLLNSWSSDAQIWKRVKDSVKHKRQYGLYAGVSAFTNFNIEAGFYYNRYKILYTRKKAIGLEMMAYPYKAFAPKFSYHAQVLAYFHAGGQAGIYTDFKSLAPFIRPEIGYSYRKYLDIRVGKNFMLPLKNELTENINTWQVSAILNLRVFSKKK